MAATGCNKNRYVRKAGLWAAAAMACVSAFATQAAVIDSGPVSITIPNNIDGIYFNVRTGTGGSTGAGSPGWDVNLYLTGGGLTFFWPATPTNSSGGVATAATGGTYTPQALGAVIGPASTFSVDSGGAGAAPFANFRVSGDHNLGIRFFNETTNAINYGFVTIRATGPTGFPATIIRYVYEDSGAAITVAAGSVAPTFAYTPATGSTVGFTGSTTIGGTASGSIAVALGTPAGSGTGAAATTTLTCTPPTAPFAGFSQTITAVGNGAISGGSLSGTCTVGPAAVTQTLTCNENRGGTANARTWTLSCPAGIAVVQPVDALSNLSKLLMLLAVLGVGLIAVRRH